MNLQHLHFPKDPWQAVLRDKDVEKVNLIGPRAECLSVVLVLMVGVA